MSVLPRQSKLLLHQSLTSAQTRIPSPLLSPTPPPPPQLPVPPRPSPPKQSRASPSPDPCPPFRANVVLDHDSQPGLARGAPPAALTLVPPDTMAMTTFRHAARRGALRWISAATFTPPSDNFGSGSDGLDGRDCNDDASKLLGTSGCVCLLPAGCWSSPVG